MTGGRLHETCRRAVGRVTKTAGKDRRFGGGIPRSPCRNSSKAEQAICNGQVVGSIPAFGSKGYAQAYCQKASRKGAEAWPSCTGTLCAWNAWRHPGRSGIKQTRYLGKYLRRFSLTNKTSSNAFIRRPRGIRFWAVIRPDSTTTQQRIMFPCDNAAAGEWPRRRDLRM